MTINDLGKVLLLVLVGMPQLMAAELTFSVSGLRSGDGELYVGLFKGKNNYQANKAQRMGKA